MRSFYLHWLQIACIITVITGNISWLGALAPTAEPWRWLFDLLTWPLDGWPSQFDFMERALNGVLGGIMVGWGTMMFLFTRSHVAQGDTKAAKNMIIAVVVWFTSDSSASVLAGIPANVILNTFFLLLFLIPLSKLAKEASISPT